MLAERKMSIGAFKFHWQIPLVDGKISKKRLKGNVSKSVQILIKNIKKIKLRYCIFTAIVHGQISVFLW